jgi:hypothetical protein
MATFPSAETAMIQGNDGVRHPPLDYHEEREHDHTTHKEGQGSHG